MQTASVQSGGRYEGVMESARVFENPVHDVEAKVEFVSPSGRRKTVDAFWDGGQTWRARFSADEVGAWEARAVGDVGDVGLDSWSARFESTPYAGQNSLYAHGPVRVSGDGHYLEHEDGTPFFLLGDTAWNGPMLSTPAEWTLYLADRQGKRFNAVLFLPTQFRACEGTRDGRRAYYGRDPIRIDPLFFQQIDARVDQINDADMLAVPLLLHAGKDTTLNVGYDLARRRRRCWRATWWRVTGLTACSGTLSRSRVLRVSRWSGGRLSGGRFWPSRRASSHFAPLWAALGAG